MAQSYESKTVTDIQKFAKEYAMSGVQIYERIAKGIEGDQDNCCMVTLPCKNKDKTLLILVKEIDK